MSTMCASVPRGCPPLQPTPPATCPSEGRTQGYPAPGELDPWLGQVAASTSAEQLGRIAAIEPATEGQGHSPTTTPHPLRQRPPGHRIPRSHCESIRPRCEHIRTRCELICTRCESIRTRCQRTCTQCESIRTGRERIGTECESIRTKCERICTCCQSIRTECERVRTRCELIGTQCEVVRTRQVEKGARRQRLRDGGRSRPDRRRLTSTSRPRTTSRRPAAGAPSA